MILEKESFLYVNNKLNLPTSSSSSSSFSFSSSSNFSIFSLLTSPALSSSEKIGKIIDTLLKQRDKFPMQKDVNSVIYAVLSHLNPKICRSSNLTHNNDTCFLLNDTFS
jgi:hypothetical protein